MHFKQYIALLILETPFTNSLIFTRFQYIIISTLIFFYRYSPNPDTNSKTFEPGLDISLIRLDAELNWRIAERGIFHFRFEPRQLPEFPRSPNNGRKLAIRLLISPPLPLASV